jgi:hypothetical protein
MSAKLNKLKYFTESQGQAGTFVMTNGHKLRVAYDAERQYLILQPEHSNYTIKLFGDSLNSFLDLVSSLKGQ